MISGINLASNRNLSFGRALTTEEDKKCQDLMKQAREELKMNNTAVICFDVSYPSGKQQNIGMGTSFSDKAQEFVSFMRKKFGITALQNGPQGKISKGNISPYSASVFSIGEHLIDLKKLTQDNYGNLISDEDYNSIPKKSDEKMVEYEGLIGDNGVQDRILRKAFDNFRAADENSPIKQEYKQFIDNQDFDWLDRDSLYVALTKKHGNDYWKNWNDEIDRNLFKGTLPDDVVEARKKELNDTYKDDIEFNKFTQFIANKQMKEAKVKFKENNVGYWGDCLIGFSPREHWSYQSSFKDGECFGGQGDNGAIPWGLPAVDYRRISDDSGNLQESGKLLKHKFDMFFDRYDGVRVDAAWQLIKPFIYDEGSKEKAGVDYVGDKIFNILETSAKEHEVPAENVQYEFWSSFDINDSALRNKTQIHHSIYQGPNWGSVNHCGSLYRENYAFGLGTHDDVTLIQLSEDPSKVSTQAPVLAKNLRIFNEQELHNKKKEFRRAKWAEIFTARNNFFTVADAFGVKERFNDQSPSPNNWKVRIPSNYEEMYHRNIIDGKGLNAPLALADALKIRYSSNENLINDLTKMGKILEENGPLTEEEANRTFS